MDRVQGEPFRFECPLFADELVGCEAFERFQPAPEVACADEVGEVISQLILVVRVEAFDARLLQRRASNRMRECRCKTLNERMSVIAHMNPFVRDMHEIVRFIRST